MSQAPARPTGLVYQNGREIPAHAVERARRIGGMRAMGGPLGGRAGWGMPYEAASLTSPELGEWNTWIRSPDSEINAYRDRMVARQRDLVRNDGWTSGVVARLLDSTIGGYYRLVSQPDYRALAARFGPKYDATWANEYRRAAEARFRAYSEDPGHYNDTSRQLTTSQQFRLALRHKLIDGESLMLRYWLPQRIGRGAARYATSYLVVDPDRLSNPYQQPDQQLLRSGVEIDEHGVPVAYHIRKAHQNDWYNAVESMRWERVLREDEDGWQRVIHDYDRERAGQSRGVSIFAPVLGRMKMLARYYGVKLQADVISSIFGFSITSPYDREMIQQALNEDESGSEISAYAYMREGFHERNDIQLDNARIMQLAPGEQMNAHGSARPPGEFTPFAHEMLRSVGACIGLSGEQVTNDYSEVNFSSMRVGIVNCEKMYQRRLADFNSNTATPVYAGWLEEAHKAGDMADVLPRHAPEFIDARVEFSRCRWLGQGRGWYDPVGERQGAVLGLDAGFDTLENVCAVQGFDAEEVTEKRAVEVARFRELGLPLPEWGGRDLSASQSTEKPEPR